MDKKTLSHYGWLIITTLVLSVILALASPLGVYVGDGIVSIGQQFTATEENNVNQDNVDKLGNQFTGEFNDCDHINIDFVGYKEVTCDVDGYTGDEICRKCKAVVKQGEVIKAKGHEYAHEILVDGTNHKQICNICENVKLTPHTIEKEVVEPSTCIKQGLQHVWCDICGYDDIIPEPLWPDTHAGKTVFVGQEFIHQKWDCCNATYSSTHTYTGATLINATCENKGTTRYTCECGYYYDKVDIAALGHDYQEQTNPAATYRVTTATCQAKATYYKKCIRCTARNDEIYEHGNLANHNYITQEKTSTYLKSEATCLVPDTYYYKCQWCAAKGTLTYTNGSVNSSNHTGSGTLNGGGTYAIHSTWSCCGATRYSHSQVTDKYTVDSGVQYKAATCTNKRKNYLECTCGYNPKDSSKIIETGSLNASNHYYSDYTEGDYGYVGTYDIHSKWFCCNLVRHSHNPSADNYYADWTKNTTSSNCRTCACGYKDTSHNYTKTTTSATCRTCSDCGYKDTGHDYSNTKTSATCRTCSTCGYKDTGHDYSVTTAATCTATGSKKCSTCAYVATIAKDASNHSGKSTYGGTSSVHTKYSCCGKTISSTHSYTTSTTKAATCTATGTKTHTCACGYSYTSSIAATGHSNKTKTVYSDNRCKQATRTYCGTCGATISTGSYTKNTHSHSFTTVCTTNHSTTKSCSTLGWTCNSHGKSSSSSSAGCNYRHVMCSGCKVQKWMRVCYTYYNKSTYTSTASCICAHTSSSLWRCSNAWCQSNATSSGGYQENRGTW